MEYIPPSLKFAASKLAFSRSRFRLETQGNTSLNPGQTMTLVMPENAILDLQSFRLMARVTTTKSRTVSAKAPADFSSLISSFSVFVGGVCVSQSSNDYNVISRVLKLVKSSRDRDGSIDNTLTHGLISGDGNVDDFSVAWTPQTGLWDASTRYLPTSVTGSVTIQLQLATNSVLAYKVDTVDFGTDFAGGAGGEVADAALGAFSLSEIYATVDTVNMSSGTYEALLMDRLNSGDSLPIVYKEYSTFRKSGLTTNSHEVNCTVSSSSLDALYTVMQPGNHDVRGINTRVFLGVQNGDSNCANAFFFNAFNGGPSDLAGGLEYQYFVNSVPQSSIPLKTIDAAADLSMIGDRTTLKSAGHMITSLKDFQSGKAIFPCVLNNCESVKNVRSGYDARGSNSSITVKFRGITPPTADGPSQTPADYSALVIAESSQIMHISGGRQIVIEY